MTDPERVTLTEAEREARQWLAEATERCEFNEWGARIPWRERYLALSDRLREAKADAWDEGYMRCYDDRNYEPGYGQSNPYRETSHD